MKGKLVGALAALVLVVGIGNAIGGTDTSSDAMTHTLVATGEISQSSPAKVAADEVAQAVTENALAGKELAETEVKAKAEAEEKAAAEAQAKAEEEKRAQAQAQTQRETEAAAAAAAPATAPQASESNAARSSNGGSSSAVPAPSSSGGGDTVYVTKSGECYHRDGCSSLRKSKIPMSRGEAASRYSPCSNCRP